MIEFWRSLLSDSSKKQYDMLLNGIRQRKRSVDLLRTPNILNEIQSIYASVLHDHPELYYLSPQFAIAGSILSLNANLSYLYDDKQRQEIDRSFDNFQQSLAKELNKTDVDKVYAATFLILKNSRYEINNIYNQIPDSESKLKKAVYHYVNVDSYLGYSVRTSEDLFR